MIIVLVLVGQVLESRARARTGGALRALLDLTPATVWLVAHGEEREVALASLAAGAVLRERPGASVPVDGTLVFSPIIAGAAMSLSSVTVIANARRLRRIDLAAHGESARRNLVER